MLDYIDNMLRQLFITQVPLITSPLQVRFQPPDDAWRTEVSTLGKPALNVYMIELKENREVHSCGRTRVTNGGVVSETPLPRYVDVHYLITAWDYSGPPSPGVEPTVVEHELLWGVIAALMDADPLTPQKIYAPSQLPGGFPALIADAEIPTVTIPHDGFGKHAEFWGTMPGHNHPWRPAVVLILTLPVTLPVVEVSPMVTTRITEYPFPAGSGEVDLWAEIGGTVYNATVSPPVPVSGAWVALVNTTGVQMANTTTDSNGRFFFNQIRPGNYQLQFISTSFPAAPPRNITVPSPTGEYNLKFT
jgi:hypothetical protein